MQSDRYQGRFPGYTGKKLFEVEHPVFGRCTVAAPDENAALLPAATFWHTFWGDARVLRIREGNTRRAAGEELQWLSLR